MPKANRAYRAFMDARERYAVLYGGAGSGKSYAAAQKLVARAASVPRERFLVVRKVHKTLRASTFQLLRDVLSDWHIEAAINRTDLAIRFPNGSEILHAGLDDVEKLKSIAGITSVWIEEATELLEDDFRQVDLRLRGDCPTYRQIVLTFNPIRASHWLRRWIDSQPDGMAVWRTTHRDNAFLDPQYRRVLRTLPDENLRRIYEAGEWGEDVRGLIYSRWATGKAPSEKPDAYGLDFGFNHANALVAIWDRDPDLHVDEVVYESHLTTGDLISKMREAGVDPHIPIYCDAARPDQIEELGRAGFAAYAADKDVLAGIQTVKNFRLVVEPSAQNLLNELGAYKWQETRDGQTLDKPVKFMDHALDALRYAVHSHLGEAANTWGMW